MTIQNMLFINAHKVVRIPKLKVQHPEQNNP
jgi:hypothetical protein